MIPPPPWDPSRSHGMMLPRFQEVRLRPGAPRGVAVGGSDPEPHQTSWEVQRSTLLPPCRLEGAGEPWSIHPMCAAESYPPYFSVAPRAGGRPGGRADGGSDHLGGGARSLCHSFVPAERSCGFGLMALAARYCDKTSTPPPLCSLPTRPTTERGGGAPLAGPSPPPLSPPGGGASAPSSWGTMGTGPGGPGPSSSGMSAVRRNGSMNHGRLRTDRAHYTAAPHPDLRSER